MEDYEVGQVAIRKLTGWATDTPIDPVFAEEVGRRLRLALEKVSTDVMAAWRAVPWHVRLRARLIAMTTRPPTDT